MAWALFVVAEQETLGVFELQDQDILVCMVLKLTVAAAVAATVAKYKYINRRIRLETTQDKQTEIKHISIDNTKKKNIKLFYHTLLIPLLFYTQHKFHMKFMYNKTW